MFHVFHRRGTRIIFFVVAVIFCSSVWASEDANAKCGRDGFNNVAYLIDVDYISSVSAFFNQIPETYFGSSSNLLVISRGTKSRLETYFDDNDLSLLENNRELLISVEENLPSYRVGREQVVFRDNNLDSTDFFEVRRYKKKATPLDKHELFGRVKRKQRQVLIDKLQVTSQSTVEEFGVKLQVRHQEIVQLYRHFGIAYGAITLDQFNISNFGIANTFSLLKFELYLDETRKLEENERIYLINSFCEANSNFKSKFEDIPPYSSFGYRVYYQLALGLLPSRSLFKKYPLLYEVGQIFVLVIIGFLIVYLFIGRYTKRQNYRKVMTRKLEIDHDGK